MENMQLEIVNEVVECKDIGIDEQSLRKNSDTEHDIPSESEESEFESNLGDMSEDEDTDLGTLPIPAPIVSTRDGMIQHLEACKDDTRFIMEVIRAATIEYTPEQRRIIEKIEREYEQWYNPSHTQMVNYFDKYVTELRDTFYHQEAQDDDFFEDQKNYYLGVYRALTRYPFPYSDRQINLLESYKAQIDWTTGDPTQMADIGLMEDLQGLLSLMGQQDHIRCSKFYVDCTVEYYVQQIVDELFYPSNDEQKRKVPHWIPEGALVNVATYVMNELKSIFNGVHYDTHISLFHLGLSQIYTKMINNFRFSGLLFTPYQRELMRLSLNEIEDVVRNPTSGKYDMLHLGFFGFIDALRHEHQVRETKEEDGYEVINEEGTIARAVQKIMKEFYELQVAAEEHHKHFEEYTSEVPDITKTIFRYFVRIFPPDQRIPISIMLPNGYYASALAQEWFQQN